MNTAMNVKKFMNDCDSQSERSKSVKDNDESLSVHRSELIEVAELWWNGASEVIPVQVPIKKSIVNE